MSVKQLVTAEELWMMPDVPGKQLELIEGEVVEVAGSGMLHGLIAGLVYRLLSNFLQEHDLGLAFGDNVSYVLRRDPDVVRIPDASFLSWERVPEGGIPEGFSLEPPDLAVEIVSPGDVAQEVYGKVHEYLDAGTRVVWVLWPSFRSVSVYTPGGMTRELGPEDELSGGDVLPGFTVRVAELFAVPRQRVE